MPLHLPDRSPIVNLPVVKKAEKTKTRSKKRELAASSVKCIASIPEGAVALDAPPEVEDFPKPAVNVRNFFIPGCAHVPDINYLLTGLAEISETS